MLKFLKDQDENLGSSKLIASNKAPISEKILGV